MEQELRRMFEIKETDMAVPPTLSQELRNRIGRQRMVIGGLVAAAAAVVVVGGFAGARSLSSDNAAPVRPAEEGTQETEPMRNGPILQAKGPYWQGNIAPPPPSGEQSYHWDAFDQDSGSFLYAGESKVWVVGEDGLVAEIDCPPSSVCQYNDNRATFGPGPNEVTVPATDSRSVYVIGFDGTLHDTLDISAVLSQGQDLSDLAWSPDGDRLAVSTELEFSTDCDRSSGPCGRVWILDRDGGEPQLVYNERTTEYTVLRDLAWSPRGDSLALLVAPPGVCEAAENAWPRLVALRVAPNEPVRAETLNVYDDWGRGLEGLGCAVPANYHLAFPFAWSPDGTRIAVHRGDGVTEISAENGEVLVRHPGEGPEGPLAWLAKR